MKGFCQMMNAIFISLQWNARKS